MAATVATTTTTTPLPVSKVVIRFRAIGNAPILRQPFFKISSTSSLSSLIAFLRNELSLKKSDSLFLYVNQAFAPSPDEVVGDLFECFAAEGHLVVNYCTTPAWG
ncbi:Ubiquitin-like protein [Sorochytrium milnesiophthora]